jgi:hypothetical protein
MGLLVYGMQCAYCSNDSDKKNYLYSGSYSYFLRFRVAIAKAAGYLTSKDKDGDENYIDNLHPLQFSSANYQGIWETIPGNAIDVLLIHSDCDGIIYHTQQEALLEALKFLIEKIDKNYLPDLVKFISGLEYCIDNHLLINFS